MLNQMILEYTRLITKYSATKWHWRQTSKDLVVYFNEHLEAIQQELVEVQTGERVLKNDDFLGPATRRNMKKQQGLRTHKKGQPRDLSRTKQEGTAQGEEAASLSDDDMDNDDGIDTSKPDYADYAGYFVELEEKLIEMRRTRHKEEIYNEENGLYEEVEEKK